MGREENWLECQSELCIYAVYDRTFGDFPAKNTVFTPCICGSGQPYLRGKLECVCVCAC